MIHSKRKPVNAAVGGMGTIRVRRSRPSPIALALALMLTMFFVYAISLSGPEHANDAAAQLPSTAEVRMEGMDISFLCAERVSDPLEARIRAAYCDGQDGAGLILPDGDEYAIILEAVSDPDAEGAIRRQSEGLTLKLRGNAEQIAAISGAVDFLRAQAVETGALAAALENGGTDATSIRALLEVYRTQGERAQSALADCTGSNGIAALFQEGVDGALARLDAAIAETDPGSLRLIHAAACAQWLQLLEALPSP